MSKMNDSIAPSDVPEFHTMQVKGTGEESSLDLDLDISLPAIDPSPDKKIHAVQNNVSPEMVQTTSLLMSDERELLKDLQCFEDEAP